VVVLRNDVVLVGQTARLAVHKWWQCSFLLLAMDAAGVVLHVEVGVHFWDIHTLQALQLVFAISNDIDRLRVGVSCGVLLVVKRPLVLLITVLTVVHVLVRELNVIIWICMALLGVVVV
jgi:hypothetical protein